MSEPFTGEIRMFAGNFAPRGWSFCDGQLLSVSQNEALSELLKTIYGGDGRATFALPDLRGRIPVHTGTGPRLTPKKQGHKFGQETITLTASQLPPHTHDVYASNQPADSRTLAGKILSTGVTGTNDPETDKFYVAPSDATAKGNLISGTVADSGGSQSHANMMPFLCVNFIIALAGVYPSRS